MKEGVICNMGSHASHSFARQLMYDFDTSDFVNYVVCNVRLLRHDQDVHHASVRRSQMAITLTLHVYVGVLWYYDLAIFVWNSLEMALPQACIVALQRCRILRSQLLLASFQLWKKKNQEEDFHSISSGHLRYCHHARRQRAGATFTLQRPSRDFSSPLCPAELGYPWLPEARYLRAWCWFWWVDKRGSFFAALW